MTDSTWNLTEDQKTLWHFGDGVNFWEKCPGGFIAHHMAGSKENMSHEQLRQLDPRLPVYLDRVTKFRKNALSMTGVYGADVGDTVRIWLGIDDVQRNIDGKDYAIYSINNIINNGETVLLDSFYKKIIKYKAKVDGVSTVIEHVSDRDFVTLNINKAWLDQNHPEWQARWATIQALDVNTSERGAFLFPNARPSPVVDIGLPNDLTG